MDPRLGPLATVLELNTRLFRNCLHGLDDELALRRIDPRTNHVAFLASHLVGARAYLAGALGGDGTDPFSGLLDEARTIDEVERFPSLEDIREGWNAVSARVMDRLARLAASELDAQAPARFPVPDATVLAMVAFLVQHDSYHIGQMALLRKHLGFDPMTYGEPEEG